MSQFTLPEGYSALLGGYDTQKAISLLKRTFEDALCNSLHLTRVSAPLFVDPSTGLNDDLNGVERAVEFDIAETGTNAQIVHSLAKWKRMALHQYGFGVGEGIVTDMNAVRRDEEMDNLHSIYVDQWDWEKVIDRDMRTRDYLENTVQAIVHAICGTLDELRWQFPDLRTELCRDVKFITAQELLELYPDKTAKERENAICEEYKTVFILQIGDKLSNGERHDGRAPDYDDWSLNGDLLFWHEGLSCALEISSMGIRVDAESMAAQLEKSGCENRAALPFHKMVLNNTLPLSIGGGIGQSRLCMLLLGKVHVGEVQVSMWDAETEQICEKAGVILL